MPTVWIHRKSGASDILVRFPSWRQKEAYEFARLIRSTVIVHPRENFKPDDYKPAWMFTWNFWGFVELPQDEARDLAETKDEPNGYIPRISQTPWKKDGRSIQELDNELESYMYGYSMEID